MGSDHGNPTHIPRKNSFLWQRCMIYYLFPFFEGQFQGQNHCSKAQKGHEISIKFNDIDHLSWSDPRNPGTPPGYVFRAAKRLFGIPDFRYYAIADGHMNVFRRHPERIALSSYSVHQGPQLMLFCGGTSQKKWGNFRPVYVLTFVGYFLYKNYSGECVAPILRMAETEC